MKDVDGGGAISGGIADFLQLFARSVARLDPESTPNRRFFLCSASTLAGRGVKGACGDFVARGSLRAIEKGTNPMEAGA